MKTIVSLLRGINVGGRNKLSMKDLKDTLEPLGLSSIQTYIQSGNVVFKTDDDADLALRITQAIYEKLGFEVKVLCLSKDDFMTAVKENPFPEAESEPKSLHLYFLEARALNADLRALEALATKTERFVLKDKVFYLFAPEGVGRSKLAAKVEKLLAVPATARNWNTVSKLYEILVS